MFQSKIYKPGMVLECGIEIVAADEDSQRADVLWRGNEYTFTWGTIDAMNTRFVESQESDSKPGPDDEITPIKERAWIFAVFALGLEGARAHYALVKAGWRAKYNLRKMPKEWRCVSVPSRKNREDKYPCETCGRPVTAGYTVGGFRRDRKSKSEKRQSTAPQLNPHAQFVCYSCSDKIRVIPHDELRQWVNYGKIVS